MGHSSGCTFRIGWCGTLGCGMTSDGIFYSGISFVRSLVSPLYCLFRIPSHAGNVDQVLSVLAPFYVFLDCNVTFYDPCKLEEEIGRSTRRGVAFWRVFSFSKQHSDLSLLFSIFELTNDYQPSPSIRPYVVNAPLTSARFPPSQTSPANRITRMHRERPHPAQQPYHSEPC